MKPEERKIVGFFIFNSEGKDCRKGMDLSRDSDFQTNNIPVNRNKSNNGNFRSSGRIPFKVYKPENYAGLLSLTISLFFKYQLFCQTGGAKFIFRV